MPQKVLLRGLKKQKEHDFSLFKRSKLPLSSQVTILADSAYQGIAKYHANSQTPIKKNKNILLTKEQKKQNKMLSSKRIANENVIGALKKFKIIADKYRNRRKRFGLRLNLISAIYNYELS